MRRVDRSLLLRFGLAVLAVVAAGALARIPVVAAGSGSAALLVFLLLA